MLLSSMTMAQLRIMSSDSILRGSEALIRSLEPGSLHPVLKHQLGRDLGLWGKAKGDWGDSGLRCPLS